MKMRKKLLCFTVVAAIAATSGGSALAYAKGNGFGSGFGNSNSYSNNNSYGNSYGNGNSYSNSYGSGMYNYQISYVKKDYKFNTKKSIQYGKYTIPYEAIVEGMGATITYDKNNAVLTVEKGETTIVIDFKNKTVTVNGVADTASGIFKASNGKKTSALTKYIAEKLGVDVTCGKDTVTVDKAKLTKPANIKVSLIGAGNTAIAGTKLNTNALYLTATADITAGEAAGGKAELYVGDKLVATDAEITATDTQVAFTTSDGSPTNAELQALLPKSGKVTVKLYNANGDVVEAKSNISLTADYVAPTLTGISSAVYLADEGVLYLVVTGAGTMKDSVDVTKLFLTDAALNKTYRLTSNAWSGSTGVVKSATSLKVTLGGADKSAVKEFGGGAVTLKVAAGGLITDLAGNTSPAATEVTVPVIVIK